MTEDEMIAGWMRILGAGNQMEPEDLESYSQRLWGLTGQQRALLYDWVLDHCKFFPKPIEIADGKRALCIGTRTREPGTITSGDIERWRRDSVPCPQEYSHLKRLMLVKDGKRKPGEMVAIGEVIKPKGAA